MRLPDGNGAELFAQLRALVPGLRCLVLSRFRDPGTVAAAVAAGASGYLVKHARTPALVSAVRAVAAGEQAFDRDARAALGQHRSDAEGDPLALLTPRESAVLLLIGQGLTNRQIGERLGLAEKTVKNYTSNLLAKLGLERRTQAAIVATERRHRSARRTGHRSRPSTAGSNARSAPDPRSGADLAPGDLPRACP
jgi:DNA-binding NarL/FixJ family response regulator